MVEDILAEAVAALKTYGSRQAAADALDITYNCLKKRIRRAAERGLMGTEPVLPGFRIARVSTGPHGTHVTQKPELGDEFEMPDGQVIKGVSALVDPEGRVIQRWIKTRTDSVVPHLVQSLKSAFEQYTGAAELIAAPDNTDARLLSVYPIADQHHGLMAWALESGENYDLKIGAKRLRTCMARLVAQAPASKAAIILNLGDWQHTDDATNQTPRGHNILDVDGRYFKVLTTGVQLMMDCIDMALRKHETVLVRNLPGNHDPHASIALTVALSSFYANNSRVVIDTSPDDFFFHRFGATLIGAVHGHKMRPDKMAMSMAVRRREDWGATKFHWFLFGHIHHESVKEVGDVRCESFQTLAAQDAYSASSGYNSGQSLNSVTLDYEDGEIGRHRINIAPELRKRAA